jgi:decaprenyl-phosphate phosphoribosyltransferase
LPLYSRLDIEPPIAPASEEQPRLSRVRERPTNPLREALPQAPREERGAASRSPWQAPTVLIRALRPRQWTKNLLVLAAPLAAGAIDWAGVPERVLGAFVVLCMISGATYLVNDVRDREQDRVHPRKRLRPIAAGELSVRAALAAAVILSVAGLALAAAITPGLAAVAAGYLAVTLSYSLWWRRVVVIDILAIAAGFVLRALAGGVATDIYLSRWFAIVTACGAIFLVAAKRYAELREHVAPRLQRATLRHYSLRGLRLTLAAAATLASIAYVSWAFTRPSHLLWYGLSIVPFLLWLGRYASLAGAGAAQAPEELILRDRTLLALSLIWGLLFLGGVYVGH